MGDPWPVGSEHLFHRGYEPVPDRFVLRLCGCAAEAFFGVLAPLAVLCLVIGLYPRPFTDALEGPINDILAAYPARVQLHMAAGEVTDKKQTIVQMPAKASSGAREGQVDG